LKIAGFAIKKIGQKDIEISVSVQFDPKADRKKYFKNCALQDWKWEQNVTLDIEYIGKFYRSLMTSPKTQSPLFYDENQVKIGPFSGQDEALNS
jgi:uncharacterized lipoprotein YddW (UPF0748 family)